MNAVFRKELRDVLRWSPIGMLLLAALCWHTSPRHVHDVNGIEANYVASVGIGCALIAIALGLLQTMFDARTDARGYLLHRPISSASIFWAKLLAGFVGYVACLLPPLTLTAIYLQSKGIERLPTSWQQLVPLAIAALIVFSLHPAAMWMAHRNARWIGTRWLPLVLGMGGVLLACLMLQDGGSTITWLCLIIVAVLLYVLVGFAARHAFIHESSLPPASSSESMSWSRAIGLFVASMILVTTVLVVAVSQLPRNQSSEPITMYRFAFSADGQAWELGETFESPRYDNKIIKRSGRKLTTGDVESTALKPLPDSWRESRTSQFGYWQQDRDWRRPFSYLAQINTSDTLYDYLSLYEHDGLLLAYKQGRGLMAIVTPRGIFTPDEVPEGRFHNVQSLAHTMLAAKNLWINLAGAPLLVDSAGVYQLDFETRKVHQLIDRPTQKVTIALPTDTGDGLLYAIHEDLLASYTIRSHDSDVPLASGDDEVVTKTNNYLLPLIDLEPVGQWKIDAKRSDSLWNVAQSDDGAIALVNEGYNDSRYTIFSPDGTLRRESQFTPTANSQSASGMLEILAAPPVAVVAVVGISYLMNAMPTNDLSALQMLFIGLVIVGAVAGVLSLGLSKRRGLSRRTQIGWALIACLTGVSALLAIIAIYPRLVREACPSCTAQRRVDEDRCGGCGADWEPPQQEGIEIFSDTVPASSELASGLLS